MTARDVDILRARLTAITLAARTVRAHLEDLHVYAYDKQAGGETKVSGGNADNDLLVTGNDAARVLWHRFEAELRHAETTLVALAHDVGNLFSAGPSPEPTRGAWIRKAEYRAAIKRQTRRAAAGDYTPHRLVDQPPYPGGTP